MLGYDDFQPYFGLVAAPITVAWIRANGCSGNFDHFENEYVLLPDVEIEDDKFHEIWEKWELRSSRSF